MKSGPSKLFRRIPFLSSILVLGSCGAPAPANFGAAGTAPGVGLPSPAAAAGPVTAEQVMRGRQLVISHGCGDCHGGGPNPAASGWLAGNPNPNQAYVLGEYRAWARNLTPDPATGIGRFSDRQIFNALRYGLRPSVTPDVEITSAVPGTGNHPAEPDYLSPLMPWSSWRHMSDAELWAVVAYLRHGVQPVEHMIPDPESPPDRWASWSTPEHIGPYPLAAFPTANEELREGADAEQVLRGRGLVASLGCSDCHGGRGNPAASGWLVGVLDRERRPLATQFEEKLQVGPFATYPRNLTPDNITGLGHFSERQIFNALRYGLRPGETADVEITSMTPGEGNHPRHPKYLPPSMPWAAWRHLADDELWAIAAYLKNGLKPVRNRVPDSEGPSDFWVSVFTPENFGTYPAAAYPTANERIVR